MLKKFLLLPLLSFALTASVWADESQYENKPIKHIVIEAEDLPRGSDFNAIQVEDQLKSKVGEPFAQTVFDQDLKKLSKEYDRVDPKVEVHHNEVFITLKVWLKPLITDISFSGNYHYSSQKLKKELGIEPYTLFSRSSFVKGINKLREYYMKKGYFEAEIDYKLTKEPSKNEVAIVVNVEAGRSGHIDHVKFDGFSREEISKLKETLLISKFNPFTSWLTRKGIYNEQVIEYDKVKILEFLRDEGYANAKIEILVTETEHNDRIGISILADKGEFFTVGNVSFSGNKDFDGETVEKKLSISENTPYSPQKIQESVNLLSDYYGKKGYIDASISYEPHLVEGENAYDIHFKIDEGSPYKVGLIKIIGNNHTFPKVILRETNLEPGTTFDVKMLEATRRKLENVGYYKHVNVYPSSTSSTQSIKAPLRDVNIRVEETSTGSLGMNVGFSTVDSVYGGVELSEKNFNIAGILDLPAKGISALRGGGEFLKIQSSIGLKLTDYSLNWMKPYFLDSLWTVGVNLDKNFSRVQSNNYSIESFTTTFNSFHPLNIFVDFNAFYRFKQTNLHVAVDAPEALRNQRRNNGNISSVGMGLQYETRNHFHRPTRGVSSALTCEYAGVGGNFFFFNYGYNNSIYVPVGPLVFKTKANFNFIQPISKTKPGDIPMGERFFLATDISEVRGYRPFAIGPLFANGEPKGGISSAVLSEEVAVSLIPKFIDVFAFIDAGTLTDQTFRIDTFRASAGVGARVVAAPNLPLMVGWGYPLNPKSPNDRQGFFLSLGGKF